MTTKNNAPGGLEPAEGCDCSSSYDCECNGFPQQNQDDHRQRIAAAIQRFAYRPRHHVRRYGR